MRADTNVFCALTHYARKTARPLVTSNQGIKNMAYYLFLIRHEADKKLHTIGYPRLGSRFAGRGTGHIAAYLVGDHTHLPRAIATGHCRTPYLQGGLLELAVVPRQHATQPDIQHQPVAEPVDQFGDTARRRRKLRPP